MFNLKTNRIRVVRYIFDADSDLNKKLKHERKNPRITAGKVRRRA